MRRVKVGLLASSWFFAGWALHGMFSEVLEAIAYGR